MQEETAALVHDVIRRGLGLKERLDRGEEPALAIEQAMLEKLLTGEAEGRLPAAPGGEAEIRYALACWLDELFVLDSPWAGRWNERKLEVALFGTNDRAWKFWEKARRASARSEGDVLEVYYLCAMLGFRGELRGEPEKVRAWAAVARAQIEKDQDRSWAAPPELDPPSAVPPLRGREKLQAMVFRAAVVVLLLIPAAAFFVVLQLGR